MTRRERGYPIPLGKRKKKKLTSQQLRPPDLWVSESFESLAPNQRTIYRSANKKTELCGRAKLGFFFQSNSTTTLLHRRERRLKTGEKYIRSLFGGNMIQKATISQSTRVLLGLWRGRAGGRCDECPSTLAEKQFCFFLALSVLPFFMGEFSLFFSFSSPQFRE